MDGFYWRYLILKQLIPSFLQFRSFSLCFFLGVGWGKTVFFPPGESRWCRSIQQQCHGSSVPQADSFWLQPAAHSLWTSIWEWAAEALWASCSWTEFLWPLLPNCAPQTAAVYAGELGACEWADRIWEPIWKLWQCREKKCPLSFQSWLLALCLGKYGNKNRKC